MLKSCCTRVTSVAGSRPAWLSAAKISNSLPKPQLPIVLALEVGRRRDALVGEGHLQRARALEDLGDVDDVRAGLAGGERLGHPGDGEVDVAVGELLLRHDVDAAFDELDVEARTRRR